MLFNLKHMEANYKEILKLISKLKKCCCGVGLEEGFFDKQKLQSSYLKELILTEESWISFFLPSNLEVLKKNKAEYIKCVGSEVYTTKKKALELLEDQKKLHKVSKIVNPLAKVNGIVVVMLLEIIYALKHNLLKENFVEKNKAVWVETANHFGLWKLRYLLEDTLFYKADQKDYDLIKSLIQKEEKIQKSFFQEIISILEYHLEKNEILDVEIIYRKKNTFGIYQKIQAKGKNINNVTDFFGFRVIVNTMEQCYQVQDILHYLWPYFKDRYKDYIKNPKENQYQSIHTTLSCLNGQFVEFQIRTKDMDRVAKFGPASHVLYKKQKL